MAVWSCGAATSRHVAPVPTVSPIPAPAVFTLFGLGAPRVAFDWDGERAALPSLPAGYVAAQSPDGREVAIEGSVYDLESGRPVGAWPKGSVVFGSAGPITCGVRDDSGASVNVQNAPEYLWVGDRKVRTLGINGRFGAPTILACSISDGFAVVTGAFNSAEPVTVYRLTDGKVLWQLKDGGQFAVSEDGRLIAVVRSSGIEILSLPDGRRVGLVAVVATPIGFSGDGSRLAVTVPSQPRFQSLVVEWTTGLTLWSHIDGVFVMRVQPGGPGMILMTPHISSGPHEFWLLPKSGRPARLSL